MKKILSLTTEGFFWIVEENKVYKIYDRATNRNKYYDFSGNLLEEYNGDYKMCEEEEEECDDCETYDIDDDSLYYNRYGVAEGNECLVDIEGRAIPDTQLNCVDSCDPNARYYTFCLLSEEQEKSIDLYGIAENIKMNIYDTKCRKYVVKGIPESKLALDFFHGEPEVVKAAAEMIEQYDYVQIQFNGTIVGHSGNCIDVFDYFQE